MTLFLCFLALVVCHQALAAPASSSQSLIPVASTQSATDIGLSSGFILYTDPSSIALVTSTLSVISTSFSNLTDTTSSQVTSSNTSSGIVPATSLVSSFLSSSSTRFMSLPTSTILVTAAGTAFDTTTIDAAPSRTSITTVFMTETATATLTTTPSPSWDNRTLWAPPPQMTDLSAFNVTYFPSGRQNLHIVSEIPSKAIASTAKFLQDPVFLSPNATILQLVYPANSVNPSSKPAGGADFYASPLNLTGAHNVTLAYSVFFPVDFDWVKGGKLPGLFGGHTGCSGGSSASNCFSTRLMWRPQGIGELYLYAPKDKQSAALCADVQSVCDATYGFSIGRGTFNFTAGDWTRLSQNVVLNTPGRNDGGFTLIVDGRSVIDRTDIFYRDVAQKSMLQPPEFLGLFFSTFFGGHGKEYATPKQQYTWFKDFTITRHD